MPRDSLYQRLKRILFGAPRDLFDPKIFHNVSLVAFFAWVGLGADGISSSSYGPEEAFLALGGHTVLALFVAAATVLTVFIISARYSQIIEAFPIMVSGYNGPGMHVFFSIVRSFPGTFRNFVFLSAGVVDTSRFKGAAEIGNLSTNLREQLRNYVEFVKGHGYNAEARYQVGTEVIEIIHHLSERVVADFPNVVFFAGRPMIVMPIRVLE